MAVPSSPALRIGDAERTAVDRRLQEAAGEGLLTLTEYDERSRDVWAARTRADLDAVVADLPAPSAHPEATAPAQASQGHLGRPKPRWSVAVFGQHRAHGPVAARQATYAVAAFGETTVDLRRTDLPRVVDVRAVALLGAAKVLVPVGARVEANGLSLFGSREENLEPAVQGGPVVRVHGFAFMGGIEIGHGAPSEQVAAGVRGRELTKGERRAARRRGPDPTQADVVRRNGRRVVVAAVVVTAAIGCGAILLGDTQDNAIFGSSTYTVQPGQTDVRVGVLFGSEKVVVPRGTSVQLGGTVIFGSKEDKSDGGANTPVTIHASGGFGSVTVVNP